MTTATKSAAPKSIADKLKSIGINASRATLTLLEPEALTLITDPSDPLYDERVNITPDPNDPIYQDILAFGVKRPVEVRKNGETKEGFPIMQVVDGRQRTQILRHINASFPNEPRRKLPVIFVTGSDSEMVLRSLSSNLHQREETPLTKSVKIKKALALGCSPEEVARACNLRSVKPIEDLLLIQNFIPEVQQAFNGTLPQSAIQVFAKVPRQEQAAALENVRSGGAKGARQVKEAVAASREGKTYKAPETRQKAMSSAQMEKNLARLRVAQAGLKQSFGPNPTQEQLLVLASIEGAAVALAAATGASKDGLDALIGSFGAPLADAAAA